MPVQGTLPSVIHPAALNNLEKFPSHVQTLIRDHEEHLASRGPLLLANLIQSKTHLDHRLQTIERIKEIRVSKDPNRVRLIEEVLGEVNNPSSKITSSHKVDLLLALLQAGVRTFAVNMALKGAAIQTLRDLRSQCGKKLDTATNEEALDEFFNTLLVVEIDKLEDDVSTEAKLDEWLKEAMEDHPFKAPMLGAIAKKSYLLGDLEDTSPFLNKLIETLAEDGKLNDQDISSFMKGLTWYFATLPSRYNSTAMALFDTICQKLLNSMKDMQLKEELSKNLTDAINQPKSFGSDDDDVGVT